jgi:hypothetical protein
LISSLSQGPKNRHGRKPPWLFFEIRETLHFGHRNGFLITHFYAALATQALLCIDRDGLSVLHLIDVNRANLDAFLAPFTLIMVNNDFIGHLAFPPLFYLIRRCSSAPPAKTSSLFNKVK